MMTETSLGIIQQPKETCPKIDKVIRAIRSIQKMVDGALKYPDQSDEILREIDSELYPLEDQLEEIRKANAEIREWGQSWKDVAQNPE